VEYIASIAAVRGAQQLRDEGLTIDGKAPEGDWLRGDSVTALKWAEEGKVNSELALNASMLSALNTVTARMQVLATRHLPAELNLNADLLSRLVDGELTLAQALEQSRDMRGARVIDLRMQGILSLCDPRLVVETEGEFARFWEGAREALRQ
jgi:hypothetical protein